MANNRLYIRDPEDGSQVLLAKGWGRGWELWDAEKLADWLSDREFGASDLGGTTRLLLRTEADAP